MTAKKKKQRKGHYHTGTHVSPKAGECSFRSGWELLYMQWLDAESTVKSYQYEGVIVPYINNVRSGKIRRYWPDFIVEYTDGRRIMVEIKPKKRLDQANVQKKLAAAGQYCLEHEMALEIVTECELVAMGLMK